MVNSKTQNQIDTFGKDESYLHKLRFERACEADIQEAEKAELKQKTKSLLPAAASEVKQSKSVLRYDTEVNNAAKSIEMRTTVQRQESINWRTLVVPTGVAGSIKSIESAQKPANIE